MKATVRIEEVRKGERINGKQVVEVLHRFDVMTRFGKLVEVER